MKTNLIIVSLLEVFACSQGVIETGYGNPEIENEEDEGSGLFHFDYSKVSQVAEMVNWTERGAVSPDGDEQHWRNSWAFAVAGVIESRHFIAHKNTSLTVLSKQNLVDCCKPKNGTYHITYALTCIKNLGGIEAEASYPYSGKNRNCTFNKKNIAATIMRNFKVGKGDEKRLALYVAEGPVVTDIYYHAIQMYKHGVLNEKECDKAKGFYSVLIVGYGSSDKDGDYWIIKTSMGTQWGEGGYMRLARNKHLCGIADSGYYPQVL